MITTNVEAIRRLFNFMGAAPNLGARYNIAPTQTVPIIRREGGHRQMVQVRWGLVPAWSKDGPSGKPLINARSETAAQKPSFRTAFRKHRCLLPADGFYEWFRPKTGPKQAYWVHTATGDPFVMAGLWDRWTAPDGSVLDSVAILTTAANRPMAQVHDRMPVILDERDIELWLDTEDPDPEALQALMKPCADDLMVLTAISDKVNKVANDGPDLIEPVPSSQLI
jgi:putative SOS response-associated peptidase YedK